MNAYTGHTGTNGCDQQFCEPPDYDGPKDRQWTCPVCGKAWRARRMDEFPDSITAPLVRRGRDLTNLFGWTGVG